jgi:hypothetical protein
MKSYKGFNVLICVKNSDTHLSKKEIILKLYRKSNNAEAYYSLRSYRAENTVLCIYVS